MNKQLEKDTTLSSNVVECWACEFCINLIFHDDVEFLKGHKVEYAFHRRCLSKAHKVEGWFSRFWDRELERKK